MREGKRFQKTVENFDCQVCGQHVRGDGYTNHCPQCLWSLHVDINPGDRASPCRGLMEPVAIQVKSQVRVLTHRCEKCGEERNINLREGDSLEVVLALIQNPKISGRR